ncbi:beta-1,4-mannosyl-glycoprotein beta-1,4-N-acetylglucosaminyltransferase [Rhizoctonia solani AG-1 IB]|nr:beta-1,4-mannosyl-glycoprotein beta-1,4-N-acetylglucosaminyltransferase [Rhizoctonia solani AG-1 IB]
MATIRRRIVAIAVSLIIFLSVTLYYRYQIQNAISYASRPLWDTPEGPTSIIPHFYALGLEASPAVCKLHGVEPRNGDRQVWDAVLFSTEVDLLEVRLNELDTVVDRFFVVESNRTFTGIPKKPILQDALHSPQFARFRSKITYLLHAGRIPNKGESPFNVEREHRLAMTKLINSAISPPLTTAPLVIMSDVDEIPAAHTIALVKKCAFPRVLHFQLRNYVYSFEWPSGWRSWRAQVEEWGPTSQYIHSHSKQRGDHILWDAGWHCSFCFKTIEEFVTKMRGYSHADRIGGDMSLLDPKRIQETVCSGRDIFNMLPEAYTYKEMFELMHPEP